jgi:hypothetical protein
MVNSICYHEVYMLSQFRLKFLVVWISPGSFTSAMMFPSSGHLCQEWQWKMCVNSLYVLKIYIKKNKSQYHTEKRVFLVKQIW